MGIKDITNMKKYVMDKEEFIKKSKEIICKFDKNISEDELSVISYKEYPPPIGKNRAIIFSKELRFFVEYNGRKQIMNFIIYKGTYDNFTQINNIEIKL